MVGFKELWAAYKAFSEASNQKVWDLLWTHSVAEDYMKSQKVAAKTMGITYQINPKQVMNYYQKHGLELVKTLTETDKNAFKDLLSKNFDLPFDKFYEKTADSFVASPARAKLIYDTEKHDALTNGYDDYVQNYVEETGAEIYKTFHHSGKEHFRPEHKEIHGETVKLNDRFSNGIDLPGGPNCGCWIIYTDASTNPDIVSEALKKFK